MRRVKLCVLAIATALLSGCGAGHSTSSERTSVSVGSASTKTVVERAAVAMGPLRFVYHHAYTLPAPLRDPAYAGLGGGRFALIGGLSSADSSTNEIDLGSTRATSQVASIGVAQHDAQAALLGTQVYVFGGGSSSELSHIFSFDPRTAQVATVGSLPSASSDSSVASHGNTAYVVGGYDGTYWLKTVLAFTPSHPTPTVFATLPIGLRYSAVAVVGNDLIVIGGTTPTGVSDAVFRVDLRTHHVSHIATLSHPVCHGEAVTVGKYVYLVGGRGDLDTSQTAEMLAIDPRNGKITPAGHLPVPLSDAALIPAPHGVLIIGGLEPSGAVNQNVGLLKSR